MRPVVRKELHPNLFDSWLSYQDKYQKHVEGQFVANVISFGAAVQRSDYTYLREGTDTWSKVERSRLRVDAGVAGAYIVPTRKDPKHRTLRFTIDFMASYARKYTAETKKGKWCTDQDKPVAPDDGPPAALESCSEVALGMPKTAHQLTANLLFGGIDVNERRYRFSAGPSFALVPYQSVFVGAEVPFLVRLTPEAKTTYIGPFAGYIRVRPVLGAQLTDKGWGVRALIVLELQALQTLFGDRTFSWM